MAFKPDHVSPQDRAEITGSGLCSACVYVQVLRSKRSSFVRCGRHDLDSSWPRYPSLPMVTCGGFLGIHDEPE